MSKEWIPKVSIGLPVYNGEKFLAKALDSLLGQTFGDFELLISDDASRDGTWEICNQYAAMDNRIRLHRFDRNRGASPNFNHTFHATRGRYFKWAAHDDICLPRYLERCVSLLDSHPDGVLAHCLNGRVYADDSRGKPYGTVPHIDGTDRLRRFQALVLIQHRCIEIFSVMRREVLERTPLLAPYVESDRNLLAEMGLHGRYLIEPEILFLRRSHDNTSVAQFPSDEERIAWFDASAKGKTTYPMSRRHHEFLRMLDRVLPEAERPAYRRVIQHWREKGRHFSGRPVREILAAEVALYKERQAAGSKT